MEAAESDASDAALLEAIAVGRAPALAEAELCRRYQQRVYLYGLKHTRDREAAADLVQEVLAMMLQKARARQIQEPERFGSFVLGTCRMLVTSDRRKAQRRGKILAQYFDPREPSTGEPSAPADLLRVQACLGGLSERERGVLLLSYYAELDAAAIADEIAISSANVRVIRHRALERMHECMQAPSRDPRTGRTT